MNIKKIVSTFLLLVFLLLVFSCSNKKNTNTDSNFLAYYNTFYSAKRNFDDAVEIMLENNNSSIKPSSQSIVLLDKAIFNAHKIEQKFYNTKYIDDAYYIIARSTYMKGKISGAKYYFTKIVNDYPDSQYYYESLIWLGFINIDLGKSDILKTIISDLENNFDNLSPDLYLFYLLKAKSNEFFNTLEGNDINYLLAIDYSKNKFDKINIYKKLLNIYEEDDNYIKCIEYIDALLLNIDDSEINTYLEKWFYYNSLNKDYIKNYNYINDKLNNNLSTIDNIFYKLQMAATFRFDNKTNEAKNIYIDLVDEYGSNNAANLKLYFCDVYYNLGLIYLENYGDFYESKMYFDKCKQNCITDNKKKSKDNSHNYLKAINNYLILSEEYELISKSNDTVITKEDQEKNPFFVPVPKNHNNQISPEKLLFEIGLILLFELDMIDSSIVKFKNIQDEFESSEYAYKSTILLAEIDSTYNLNDTSMENFSSFLDKENNDFKLVDLRRNAWRKLDENTSNSINDFLLIYNDYNDPYSLYYAAYLFDEYMNDIKKSLKFYREYQNNFNDHDYTQTVQRRIDEIESLLDDEIDIFYKRILYNKSYYFISNIPAKIDSAMFYLEKCKDINIQLPIDSYIDNLILFIDDFSENLDTIKVQQIKEHIQYIEIENFDSTITDTISINDFFIDIDINKMINNLDNIKSLKNELFESDKETIETDKLFVFNQSIHQYFYFVETAFIDDLELTSEDWMVAYNNEVIVGARKYKVNGNIDIPIMGFDDSSESTILATDGYCMNGDIPVIKIHRMTGDIIEMNVESIEGGKEFKSIGHSTVILNNK